MRKIFELVVYATCISAILYCLQPLLNTTLLNRISSDIPEPEGGYITRYYNVPVFIYPVIFFLFYPTNVFGIRYRPILLMVAISTIILSQHRNVMMAVVACYLVYIILSNKVQRHSAVVYSLLAIGVITAADFATNHRFSRGLENLSGLQFSTTAGKFQQVILSELSTTEFRKLIFEERLSFILQDDTRSVLGIGLITDDSRQARPLNFHVGVPDDDGNISQISNVDIAWASMLLQFGLLGTLVFIVVYLTFLRKFFLARSDPYMLTGLLFVLCLFITSLYGSLISMPYIICLLMLFAAYQYRSSLNVEGHEPGL